MSCSPRHKARQRERAKKVRQNKNRGINSPHSQAIAKQNRERRVLRGAALVQGLGLGGVAHGELIAPAAHALKMMDELR